MNNNTPEQRKETAEKLAKIAISELSEFIKAHGISRSEIAQYTGIGQGNIAPMLSGKRIPKMDTLMLIWVAANEIVKEQGDPGLQRPSFIRALPANNARQTAIPTKAT